MPTYNRDLMLTDLEHQVKQMIAQTQAFKNMPESQLLHQPAPGKWNILEIIYHLETYNLWYLPKLEKLSLNKSSTLPNTFSSGWLGNYFTQAMLPGASGKIVNPLKAMKGHVAESGYRHTAILSEFMASEEKLMSVLQQARQASLTQRVPISISPIITIKLGDAFRFLIAHQRRHFIQASHIPMIA